MTQDTLKTGSIDKFQINGNFGGSVDLSEGIGEFRLYESVLSNTVTATAVVVETGNVRDGKNVGTVDGLPIRGGEKTNINIRDALGSTLKLDVLVNRVRNASPESTRDLYLLDFASPEYFANDTVRISKRYQGKISESVKLILQELRTTKILDIDETLLPYNFMGNDRKPFYTCTWLAQKSLPSNLPEGQGASGFLFYQTINSFKFKSIDNLLSQKPVRSFIYNAGDRGTHDDIIINYTIDRDIDLHENLTLGTYSTNGIFFDPVSFRYTVGNSSQQENKGTSSPKKTKPVGSLLSEERTSNPSRVITAILDTGTLPSGKSSEKQLEDWHNARTKPNYDVEKTLLQSIMRYNQLFTVQTTITIPGDFTIRAGDTVKCEFPQLESSKNTEKNRASSGIYMVAHVCHKITPENTLTSLSLVRDSFGK
tara:strand:- start:3793 stop:5067 length:1275 start_codon:yes stop_codon:yes gene_type:complete